MRGHSHRTSIPFHLLLLPQERDSFYQCCRDLGAEYNPANEVPEKCKTLRAAFFTACPATWVRQELLRMKAMGMNLFCATDKVYKRAYSV